MRTVFLIVSLLSSQFSVPRIQKPEHPQTELQTLPEHRGPDAAAMKAEFAKSAAEVGELVKLATEAKAAFEKADYQTLPADALRLLGEIEKKAKRARQRFKK